MAARRALEWIGTSKSHSAPVEPLCANANVLENPESVVHLKDTLLHLADSEVAMHSAVPSSHATKSALPLQHTLLQYRRTVEPHHPSSMPYRFNPTSSHYNGEPIYTPKCKILKLHAKLHTVSNLNAYWFVL